MAACVAVAGVVLTLAPAGAASAGASKPNANSAACRAIKKEQASATAAGFAIEKALAAGHFAGAKRQMLKAYDTDLRNVTRAFRTITSAPPNVRAAFKDLRTYVRQVRGDISNAKSEQQLVTNLQTLAKNAQLQNDSSTIASWASSVCGTPVPTGSSAG
jgi:hypothetical protein